MGLGDILTLPVVTLVVALPVTITIICRCHPCCHCIVVGGGGGGGCWVVVVVDAVVDVVAVWLLFWVC